MNRTNICCALSFGFGLLAACTKSAPAFEADEPAKTEAEPEERVGRPAPSAVPEGPLALGTTLPAADVEMKGVDGETHTLGGEAGEKGLLVVFTCNHCPYAKAWEERIAEIGNTYRKKGVGVVAVNPNDPSVQAEDSYEEMQARAKKLGLEFPYVVDGSSDVARAYGATKTPEAYLFDGEKKLIYHGAIDDSANDPSQVETPYLENALDALLAGEPVPMAESKAVGCTIKFRPEA